MDTFFNTYGGVIVFLHIFSAFIWVGGMITVRLVIHPVMQSIDEPKIKLGKTLEIMGRLFSLVFPFIVLLILSGFLMVIAFDGHTGENKILFITKEIIWTVMSLNYLYMVKQRAQAWKLFNEGKLLEAKKSVMHIPNFFLPFNIFLGMVALWLGVLLRGV